MPQILQVYESNPQERFINIAAQALAAGEIVIAPTETGYCFFGDPKAPSTFEKFLKLREAHPKHKPFSLMCLDLSQAGEYSSLPTPVFRIAKKVFPGPFTFILECSRLTPKYAAGPKRKTIGIRISSHPVTEALVRAFGRPLLITSVTDADELIANHYYDQQDTQEDYWWASVEEIAKKYPRDFAVALENDQHVPLRVSTVIDFTQSPPVLVRDGGWENGAIGLLDL